MPDLSAPTLANNTVEKVALDLLGMIAHIEKRALHSGPPDGWKAADRIWLLSTYTECVAAVRGAPVEPPPQLGPEIKVNGRAGKSKAAASPPAPREQPTF